MSTKKNTAKTKVKQVFNQAKASLKLLEYFEMGTLAKAGSMTNDKLLAALRKIGVSSADDVESLRLRVERLEAEVSTLRSGHGPSTLNDKIPQA